MARYENLPIYKQAMGLGLEMEKIVQNKDIKIYIESIQNLKNDP